MITHCHFDNTVWVIGAMGLDDIARPLQTLNTGASNPVHWQRFAGGVATNVARGLSQQLSVHLITVIGDDAEGQTLAKKLREINIEVSPLCPLDSRTGRYTAVLDRQGELFIGLSDFMSIELLTWKHIVERLPAPLFTASTNTLRAVVLDANLSQRCITDTVNGLPKETTRVFALTVSPAKAIRWLPVASQVYVLFCNRAEAAAMTSLPKNSALECLADGLMAAGFRQFVVSDGGSPALIQEIQGRENGSEKTAGEGLDAAQRRWVVAAPLPDGIEALHTVNGAGDAMAAATIAHHLQNTMGSLVRSLEIAGMPAAVEVLTGRCRPIPIK